MVHSKVVSAETCHCGGWEFPSTRCNGYQRIDYHRIGYPSIGHAPPTSTATTPASTTSAAESLATRGCCYGRIGKCLYPDKNLEKCGTCSQVTTHHVCQNELGEEYLDDEGTHCLQCNIHHKKIMDAFGLGSASGVHRLRVIDVDKWS